MTGMIAHLTSCRMTILHLNNQACQCSSTPKKPVTGGLCSSSARAGALQPKPSGACSLGVACFLVPTSCHINKGKAGRLWI